MQNRGEEGCELPCCHENQPLLRWHVVILVDLKVERQTLLWVHGTDDSFFIFFCNQGHIRCIGIYSVSKLDTIQLKCLKTDYLTLNYYYRFVESLFPFLHNLRVCHSRYFSIIIYWSIPWTLRYWCAKPEQLILISLINKF